MVEANRHGDELPEESARDRRQVALARRQCSRSNPSRCHNASGVYKRMLKAAVAILAGLDLYPHCTLLIL